jgi:hypothetical protein
VRTLNPTNVQFTLPPSSGSKSKQASIAVFGFLLHPEDGGHICYSETLVNFYQTIML